LENTSNKGGGSVYPLHQIQEISNLAREEGLAMHLDGARVFNAVVASDYEARDLGKNFDTISVCLSKGLGAPVGSVLLGKKEAIKEAIRVRKMMGGGMRQAGYLAAAASYALDHHVDRLKEDYRRATLLSYGLTKLDWIDEVMPVETNIVIFQPRQDLMTSDRLFQILKENGVAVSTFGKSYIRMVTHLHITDEMVKKTLDILNQV